MSSVQTTDITCQQARQSHHPKVVSTTIWPLKTIPIFCTLLASTLCCTLETLFEKSLGCCSGLDELYSLEQEEKILKDLQSHLLLTTCPKRARMNTQGKMGQASASENHLCKDQITLKKTSQIYWDTLKFLRLKFMHLHSSNARTYQLKSSFNRQICVRRGQEFVGDLLPKPRSFVSHSIASGIFYFIKIIYFFQNWQATKNYFKYLENILCS
jgi:hypothetical protein